MALHEDVEREALSDWLDERRALLADERPDASEYADDDPGRYVHDEDDAPGCGVPLKLGGCGECEQCLRDADDLIDHARDGC